MHVGIKAIKVHAWEGACMQRVKDRRLAERRSILTMEVRLTHASIRMFSNLRFSGLLIFRSSGISVNLAKVSSGFQMIYPVILTIHGFCVHYAAKE
jgi:hypothetical protein